MSYFVIKTTRSPAIPPYYGIWKPEQYPISCKEHELCYGMRWVDDGWDPKVTHELHVIPTNDAVAPIPNHTSTVYSVHSTYKDESHNRQWCRAYCGVSVRSQLNEKFYHKG